MKSALERVRRFFWGVEIDDQRGSSPAAFSFIARADLLAAATLAALVLIFFWPAVTGRAWIPRGGGDLVSFLWPTYTFAANRLRAGHLPLWNPHLYSGAPFAADNQSGLFYPVNLIAFFLLPTSFLTIEWLVFFHFWLAGAGMYAALRMERLDRVAALFGGIAFMFSDVLVTHLGNLNLVAVSAYLPLVFAFLRRGLRRGSAGWCAASGVALGIAALAGHAQMTLIVAGAAGLYGLWEIGRRTAGGGRLKTVASVLRLLGLWAIAAVGVSAISILPAMELTRYTARAQLNYAEASRWSLPPVGLIGLLSPLVFGRGPAGFWGPWERVETGYAGALTVLLAMVGLFGAANMKAQGRSDMKKKGLRAFVSSSLRDFNPLLAFFVLLFLFGLLIALGRYTPVHGWLYHYVPGFAQLRVPARFILWGDFALAWLAAMGVHFLTPSRPARSVTVSPIANYQLPTNDMRRLVILPAALIASGLVLLPLAYFAITRAAPDADTPAHRAGLYQAMTLYTAMLLCGAVAVLRLSPHHLPLTSPQPPISNLLLPCLLSLDLLLTGSRVEIEPHDPTLGFQHPLAAQFLQAQPKPTRIDSATGKWQPDYAAMLGLDDIGGISNPLALAHYDAYYWSVGHRGSPQYNFLGAQWVIADKGTPPADATFAPVYDEDPDVDIYLNTNALPRVNLIYETRQAANAEAAFALVHAPDFDPASHVVIEDGPALPGVAPEAEYGLAYLHYGAERIAIAARTPIPAYLVFAEVWYPGWRATVDGENATIYRANYAFRAVYLPAGEHRIEMSFDPPIWKIGAAITLFTLMALIIWAWRSFRVKS